MAKPFFSMRHQVICQHHPCFSTMLFGMASLLHQVLYGSKNLHQCLGCGLASPLMGPSQACVLQILQAAINCLWIEFFCCGSCRCCLSDPFTSRFFLPYQNKCCHARLKKHKQWNAMWSEAVWHKEVWMGRPHWWYPIDRQTETQCLRRSVFRAPAQKITPSVRDESPNTAHSPKQISRPPTSVGPSPQQNSTWWRRVFLEDSSCPWATYS